ncbi:class I SAM-dependent methyltransferase [Microlunatus endophyticus]|uniref:class I SAM-dependent methyltransferase n=1 Tax=Microlunatus endophyticus TaxID=1716077 RepID=UPI00166DCA22|nr:class I SAM-dependent methyltransferase [Microlunatus endophyticus]
MNDDPEFAPDLYRGVAELYDEFRLPYTPALITQLLDDTGPTGRVRALDLGCGPGLLAFVLADSFAEVWAVDSEPDMIDVVRSKIANSGIRNLHPVGAPAEELQAPEDFFDLVVVGNAFHRMPRRQVAERIAAWLVPGGHLALCWSSSPWSGPGDWKPAFGELLADWQHRLGADNQVPADLESTRNEQPDEAIIEAAGLVSTGRRAFTQPHAWTPGGLAGFIYATSFLPITIFGDRTSEFEVDLAGRLRPFLEDGVVIDEVSYAYDLFSRPVPADT